MRLLGWMHRKFRQNANNDGHPSFDDQQFYMKQNYGSKQSKPAHRDNNRRNSFAGLDDGYYYEEEEADSSSENNSSSDLFHGFLAIGTLGSDAAATTFPSTPAFTTSFENIITEKKETEVTENELRLINDELEKVLGAEAREDDCNFSSGRNSHVSNGRSSHGSIITLSGKALEETNIESESTICPLQGYLFGSAPIELIQPVVVQPKKELRTSLGELFQKSKLADEHYGGKWEKGLDKSAVQLMKKILKKKTNGQSKGSSNNNAGPGGGTDDVVSTENKFHKILHRFHKKVHPESSKTTKPETVMLTRNELCIAAGEMGYNNGDQMLPDTDIIIYPQGDPKRSTRRNKNQSVSYPSHLSLTGNDSNGNRECWIKTDADYLVLELLHKKH